MSSRSTAGLAGLGAVVAGLAWAGWGAAFSDAPAASTAALALAVPAAEAPAHAVPGAERATRPNAAPVADLGASVASSGPAPARSATPTLREGFAMHNGMPTALRAPVGTVAAQAAPAPGSVALPPGVRPEDVAVSPGGVVAVLRTGVPANASAMGDAVPVAAVGDAAASPFRPATATHSP